MKMALQNTDNCESAQNDTLRTRSKSAWIGDLRLSAPEFLLRHWVLVMLGALFADQMINEDQITYIVVEDIACDNLGHIPIICAGNKRKF
jgi:hypothetical protein